MPTQREVEQSQQTTIAASSVAETTIVTADPNFRRNLTSLIVTTINAAVATLTLRDATAGTTIAILDYPNATSAPTTPLVLNFDPPLQQQTAKNSNWTLQASVERFRASTITVRLLSPATKCENFS
jgi:hypothetical protein